MKREDYLLIGCGVRIKEERCRGMYRLEILRRREEPPFVLFCTLKGLWKKGIQLVGFVIKEELKRMKGGAR